MPTKATLHLILAALGLATFNLCTSVVQAQDYTYTTNNGTISITQYTGPGGAVTIPNTINGLPVTSLGDWAFYRSSLTSVTIPNSVSSIGINAFFSCSSLTSVTIPNSVISIGEGTFAECTSLTSVTIPNSVISIGEGTFAECTSLNAITVDTSNPAYSSVDGVLFNKTQTTLIQCPAGKAGSYTIPNSVTNIWNFAFRYCARLTSVVIPNSVTSIGDGAFGGCSLTNVTIPNSVTSIGREAFSSCTSLTSVIIPNSVTSIGGYAFSFCSSVTSVTIPNVTSIGGGAFYYCTSLTSVTIPNSVTSIGGWAFFGCTSLTSVTIPNSVTNIGNSAFDRCTSLTSVIIPNSVTSIGDFAFYYCTNLNGTYFEGSAPKGGNELFSGSLKVIVYYLPGTTGWEPTYGGRPTVRWVLPYPVILNFGPSFGIRNNGFGFIISWATNVPVVVEGSTDLANPDWLPLATNTLANGTSYFSDPEWTNYPSRFYRVRSL